MAGPWLTVTTIPPAVSNVSTDNAWLQHGSDVTLPLRFRGRYFRTGTFVQQVTFVGLPS